MHVVLLCRVLFWSYWSFKLIQIQTQNSLLLPIYIIFCIYTFIVFQVQCRTYITHTCQANPDISGSPFESQWGSLRYPGQPDMYDHGVKMFVVSCYIFVPTLQGCFAGTGRMMAPVQVKYFRDQSWLTLISAWISRHMFSNVWDQITYPFPNFNGAADAVWEWISYLIPLYWAWWLLIHAEIKVNPC